MIPRVRQAAWFLAAPLLCLAVFWRAPFIWFRIDDFAWLGLGKLPLANALFEPFAQGTIRVFSERLYFLALTELFGITSWPFRAVAMGLWFVDLLLIQFVGERLTGSRAAGLVAALLWTISPAIVTPIIWASAFNEVAIAFVFLAAFYARLRGWRTVEAALFLLGFGVLEIIVVYPAIVLLHALVYKREWRSSLWMFIPAGLFTVAHLFLIPKTQSPVYQMFFDARLPATLWQYVRWATGDRRLIVVPVLLALATFAAFKLRSSDQRPLFFAGWFLLVLAPVLPLANHQIIYYLTVPGIAIAWLAGWAWAEAWRTEGNMAWFVRIGAIGLALAYAVHGITEIDTETAWHLRITSEIRIAVRAVEAVAAKYPGSAVALTGIDDEVFLNSAPHRPFLLVGASQAWLLPGNDAITRRNEWGDLSRFRTTNEALLREIDAGRARVLDVAPPAARDVTRRWAALASSGMR